MTVIQPSRSWQLIDLTELWRYRELFYYLAWRDVKVRYKQTSLGALWAVIQPLVLAAIFTVVFGRLARVDTFGLPYLLFAYTALVPWTLFNQSLSSASDSLVSNANLVSKVYFPRLIAPTSAAGVHLVDFAVAFIILLGMLVYYGEWPTLRIAWLPALVLLTFCAALAGGIWLSALNARYRDVRYAVPFMLQALMFASPLGYSAADLPTTVRFVYALNPVTGVADGFRWALLGLHLDPRVMAISALSTIVLLLSGLAYFRHVERTLADVI